MNLKEFLENENERFYAEPVRELRLKEENADGSFSEQVYMHNWIKDHDTRLINKVLDEVKREVEKKKIVFVGEGVTVREMADHTNTMIEKISTIIDQLKLK